MSYVPLLLLGGAAVVILGGKKKKSSVSTSSSGTASCPSSTTINVTSLVNKRIDVSKDWGMLEVNIPKKAYDEAVGGNRNIVDIATKTLSPIISRSCLADRSVTVTIKSPDSPDRNLSAPEVFYYLGLSIIESLYDIDVVPHQEALQMQGNLEQWWFDNMGDTPIPGPLG